MLLFAIVSCFLVISIHSQGIFQLLTSNGLTEFHQLINSSYALQGLLTNPNLPMTIFVPNDEAINKWRAANRNAPISSDILQNHIAPGAWNELRIMQVAQSPQKNERRIFSGFLNGPLWLKYFQPAPGREQARLFINNALIITERPFQTGNQILYIIDEVISPTGASAIARNFLENPAAHTFPGLPVDDFREEVRQLAQVNAFRDTNQVYTFLVPNNAAFAALYNRGAFDASTLRGHIIPGEVLFLRTLNQTLLDITNSGETLTGIVTALREERGAPECVLGYTNSSGDVQIYSETIKGTAKYPEGRVYATIVQPNIPVTNGVIHIIDRVLFLMEQNANEVIDTRRHLFKFREWFNFVDEKVLDILRTGKDLTIFVPSNRAITAVSRERLEMLRSDPKHLEKIIRMHIVEGRRQSSTLTQDTPATAMDGTVLSFTNSGSGPFKMITVTGQSVKGRISEPDLGATNAVIHVIDHVLGIPYLDVRERLESEDTLRMTSRAIDQAGDLRSRLADCKANYTFFAPSDQAWERISVADRQFLLSRTRLLESIMKRHIIYGTKYTADSLASGQKLFSMFGDLRIVRNQSELTVRSGERNSARIIRSDLEAVNGMIHVVDRVLFDRERDVIFLNSSGHTQYANLILLFSALLVALNVSGSEFTGHSRIVSGSCQ